MALQLVEIDHAYGGHRSLSGVSLNVSPGDRYGFLGHNGAGKTTAMRIALGLSRPRRGKVLVDGFDAAAYPREARARMGGMIEVTGFYPGTSGERNLIELARLQGFSVGEAHHEVERLLDVVGLAAHAERPVTSYSQGMRQRLGLAQALIGSPRYVLLDEPTNGLDPEGIAELRELLERLTDQGVTVLLSSHQLHEVATLCNRIGVLREGRMLLEEETDSLLRSARHRYQVEVDDPLRADELLARMKLQSRSVGERTRFVEVDGHQPAEVVRTLVEAGVGVDCFAPRPVTLEEVYLRLAEEDKRRGDDEPRVLPKERDAIGAPVERLAPPGPVRRMTRFEFDRGLRPSIVGLAAVPVAIAVWRIGALAAANAADLAEVESGELFSASQVTAFEALARGLSSGLPVVVLLIAAIASQSIAGDFTLGTLRNVLLRPLHRLQVAFGKAIAVALGAAALLAVLAAFAALAAVICFDYGDRWEIGQDEMSNLLVIGAGEVTPHLWHALFSPLLPLLAYAGVGFLAGALVRRSIWALGLAVGAVISLDLGRVIAGPLGFEQWLPSAYLPSLMRDTSELAYFTDLAIGSADANFGYASTAVIVPLAWILSTFALATYVLLRRRVP